MSSYLMGKNNKWFNENVAEDMDFLKAHEGIKAGGSDIFKPVLPSEILTKFRDRANTLGLKLINEDMALSKDGFKTMYVADIEGMNGDDYSLSCGWRCSSDRTRAFQGCMGTNCLICSNGLISGVIVPSKQKNTIGNYERIGDKIDRIFERFINDKDIIHGQISLMKSTALTDDIVGKFVKAMAKTEIGKRYIIDIVNDLENPELNSHDDNSCYRLLNAGTYVTTHKITNPLRGGDMSRLVNNTIMSIISPNFSPLGDVVDVEDEVEVLD